MKKNAMLKIAAILMVAVLLTTCAISSTFAKYVTSADAEQGEARVAAFGVTISTIDLNGLFAANYGSEDTSPNVLSTGDLVVAPGTKNEGFDLTSTISGKSEVSVEVKQDVTFTLDGWTVNGSDYFPIILTINGATYGVNQEGKVTNNYDSIEQLLTAVNGTVDAAGAADKVATYPAGTVFDDQNSHDISIKWEWPESVDDLKDTELGKLGSATIKVDLKTTVTQTVEAGGPVA